MNNSSTEAPAHLVSISKTATSLKDGNMQVTVRAEYENNREVWIDCPDEQFADFFYNALKSDDMLDVEFE